MPASRQLPGQNGSHSLPWPRERLSTAVQRLKRTVEELASLPSIAAGQPAEPHPNALVEDLVLRGVFSAATAASLSPSTLLAPFLLPRLVAARQLLSASGITAADLCASGGAAGRLGELAGVMDRLRFSAGEEEEGWEKVIQWAEELGGAAEKYVSGRRAAVVAEEEDQEETGEQEDGANVTAGPPERGENASSEEGGALIADEARRREKGKQRAPSPGHSPSHSLRNDVPAADGSEADVVSDSASPEPSPRSLSPVDLTPTLQQSESQSLTPGDAKPSALSMAFANMFGSGSADGDWAGQQQEYGGGFASRESSPQEKWQYGAGAQTEKDATDAARLSSPFDEDGDEVEKAAFALPFRSAASSSSSYRSPSPPVSHTPRNRLSAQAVRAPSPELGLPSAQDPSSSAVDQVNASSSSPPPRRLATVTSSRDAAPIIGSDLTSLAAKKTKRGRRISDAESSSRLGGDDSQSLQPTKRVRFSEGAQEISQKVAQEDDGTVSSATRPARGPRVTKQYGAKRSTIWRGVEKEEEEKRQTTRDAALSFASTSGDQGARLSSTAGNASREKFPSASASAARATVRSAPPVAGSAVGLQRSSRARSPPPTASGSRVTDHGAFPDLDVGSSGAHHPGTLAQRGRRSSSPQAGECVPAFPAKAGTKLGRRKSGVPAGGQFAVLPTVAKSRERLAKTEPDKARAAEKARLVRKHGNARLWFTGATMTGKLWSTLHGIYERPGPQQTLLVLFTQPRAVNPFAMHETPQREDQLGGSVRIGVDIGELSAPKKRKKEANSSSRTRARVSRIGRSAAHGEGEDSEEEARSEEEAQSKEADVYDEAEQDPRKPVLVLRNLADRRNNRTLPLSYTHSDDLSSLFDTASDAEKRVLESWSPQYAAWLDGVDDPPPARGVQDWEGGLPLERRE
ncbi:hypothetical protein JCM10213_008143 [Rhodosporidiobolus nylandii]